MTTCEMDVRERSRGVKTVWLLSDPLATKRAWSCPKGIDHVTMGPGKTAGGTIILPEEDWLVTRSLAVVDQ